LGLEALGEQGNRICGSKSRKRPGGLQLGDLSFIYKYRIKQCLAFVLGVFPGLIQGIPSHIDSGVLTSRSTGIKGEECRTGIIENLHVFSGLATKKLDSPIKCLIENVDKHIKIGIAQIYRKKKRPPRQ
jgi:hypothetical protein